MAVLSVSLLGGFQVRSGAGTAISVPVKKAKALLAYLALHPGQPYTRDRLAALLWEEHGETQARHSLRQALTGLRKSLPQADQVFSLENDSVAIAPAAVAVDVLEFERLVEAGQTAGLERAVELYQGEFLEGFNPRAPAFEDWLMAERSRWRECAIEAMTVLLDHYLSTGANERAIRLALRLLALDPLREAVHRTLMERYAKQGRYGAAFKQYRACRRILWHELGVAPEPETERLYKEILQTRRMSAPAAAGAETSPAEPVETDLENPSPAVLSPSFSAQQPDRADQPTPELRQLSVLVVNLAEFSEIGIQLEPEEMLRLLDRYLQIVTGEVLGYGGGVVRRMNDTVMAAFGLPTAHSNDAERAVRTAEAVHCALNAPLIEQIAVPLLKARIGIASGRVMVSHPSAAEQQEYTITGEAVNRAVYLATLAGAGETLLSEAVYYGVSPAVSAERLADPGAQGRGNRPVWKLRSLRTLVPDGPAFMGRRNELRQFTAAAEAVLEAGRGQAFLIRGEAGIGKTRLVEEFMACAGARGFRCHKALVLDFGTATGQDAVRTLVRSLLELSPLSDTAQVRSVVGQTLERGLVEPDQQVFLHDLLDSPQPLELRALYDAMDSGSRRCGRQEVICRLILAASQQRPILLLVEDIHWADAHILGYLADIAATVADCPALLVMTSRVEGEPLDPAWRGAMQGAPLTTLDLGPLRDEDALAIARHWAAADNDLLRCCIRRAGGNPLFLEQLLRAAQDGETAVPDSIQSIVWARLDRLRPLDKQAAQAASVLGQRFSLEVLRHLIEDPHYLCDRLLEQRLLRPQGEDYLFAHALIQEGIYSSLLSSQRRLFHQRAAEWFAKRDALLQAEHLDRADNPMAAGAYLGAARALALEYRYERALELVKRGFELARDASMRYELMRAEGEMLRESGAIEDSIAAFERALALTGDAVRQSQALIGMAAGLSIEDRHAEALKALDTAKRLAGKQADAEQLAQIHYQRGNVLFPLGRLDECFKEQELALQYAQLAGSANFEACALSGLADAYYQRGRIITAYHHFDRCVRLCREHGLGRIEVANLAMRGITRFYQNDLRAALEDNFAAADLAVKVKNQRAEGIARSILGYLLYCMGDFEASQRQIQQSLALTRRLGARLFEAENLLCQGSMLIVLDQRAEAEGLLDQAYAICRESALTYSGAWILSTLALATSDPGKRRWALEEGERLLAQGGVSHNYLHFYQNAIEISLATGAWDEAERYAAALEDYTRLEPLPWSEFMAARGRALAASGRGDRSPATWQALRDLCEEAERIAMKVALPALQQALGSVNPSQAMAADCGR